MDLSPEKLLVLFIIAVLVLGPERLPGAARALGRGLAELRRHTSALRSEFGDVLSEPKRLVEAAAREADLRAELDVRRASWANGNGHYAEGEPEALGTAGGDGPALGLDAGGPGSGGYSQDGLGEGAAYGYTAGGDEPWATHAAAPPGAPDDPLLN